LELVRILEASSESLKKSGAPVALSNGHNGERTVPGISGSVGTATPLGQPRRKTALTKLVENVQ
jgi:hypothetical protein